MKENKLRLIAEILAVIIICLVSFFGVYIQNANRMENAVKDYTLGKDLKGYREIIIKVSDATKVKDSNGKIVGNTDNYTDSSIESNSYTKTEEKVNSDEVLNEANYNKSKEIIEQRLKKLGVNDYNISMNMETGMIYLAIPEDDSTDHTVSNILQVGDFQIRDSEDDTKIMLSNDSLKKVTSIYNTTENGTIVYLQMEFNKDGKNALNEISSGEYATKEENDTESVEDSEENQNAVEAEGEVSTEQNENSENNEENQEEEKNEKTQKKISLVIDDNSMITTSFDEPIKNGSINLSMNAATKDTSKINETLQSASTIATILNSGKLPITYTIDENKYVETDISNQMIKNVIYVLIGITILAMVFLIIKYKIKGLIAAIAYVGFIGLYLLIVRYTNVLTDIESIVSVCIILIINYLLTIKLLGINNNNDEAKKKLYAEELKRTIIKLIPLFITSIIFAFASWSKIAIFGMFIFWGATLAIIYNNTIMRDMID